MSKRTYQQFCPLAYSLDIIGERWSLLIVRELRLGPRRFSDLQRGLPGIGPNLLSRRLKDLEMAGVITAVPLPPPARIQAYSLTESGHELAAALGPLAKWGMRWLQIPIPEDDFLSPVSAISSLKVYFRPNLAEGITLTAEIHLDLDYFRVEINSDTIHIAQGFAPEASIALSTTPKGLLALVTAQTPSNFVLLRGDMADVHRFFEQFTAPFVH